YHFSSVAGDCEPDGEAGGDDTSAPPPCDEELYTRPISGVVGLFASHQYIVVNDGNGNEWTIEGEPQRVQAGNWGNLVSSVIENGYGPHDDPHKDKVLGGTGSFRAAR
ncbi:MAG: hypothetical protein ACRD9L_05675, partial [Bryobacteraceae bacterium]